MTEPDRSWSKATEPVDLEIRVSTPWGRQGGRLSFVVNSPSGIAGFHQESVEGHCLDSPKTFQTELLDQLDQLDKGRDASGRVQPQQVLRELKGIGHDLYQALFPRSMREIYREASGRIRTLLITSDEPWIPWELLCPCEHEEDDFLCMRFQMSRWLAGNVPLSFEKCVKQALLVNAGGGPELDSEPGETGHLRGMVLHTTGHEPVVESGADFERVVELLESARFDLVHLTGHGIHHEGHFAGASVQLPDRSLRGRHLLPEAEKRLRAMRPLIFFNTCHSGRLGSSLTSIGGWAERWVRRCGCTAFLAPIWSVVDERAARFSELLYDHLCSGKSLGESVLLTRHTLRDEDPSDLAWLAYTLYGAPTARVYFGDQGARRPRPPDYPQRQRALAAPAPVPPAERSVHKEEAHPPKIFARRECLSADPSPKRLHLDPWRIGAIAALLLLVAVVLSYPQLWSRFRGVNEQTDAGRGESPHIADVQAVEPGLGRDEGDSGTVEESRYPDQAGQSEAGSPEPSSSLPIPLQEPEPGKVAIIVLDASSQLPDAAVANALRVALAQLGPAVHPFIPSLELSEARDLVQGDFSALSAEGGTPWGTQYLLLATASKKSLQVASHLKSYSLALNAQLVNATDRSTAARSDETHTGAAASSEGALAQAVERCLRPITVNLKGGDDHGNSH